MTITTYREDGEDVIASELVERALAMVAVLRERSPATNVNRRLPAETIAELKAAGLLKVLQAPRNGGFGLGMAAHLDVVSALAQGCGSTAWVTGVTHAHSWLMSHFHEQAQAHTYGADPNAMISAVIGPRGRAVRHADRYVLDGMWPFASGGEHAQFLLLGAVVLHGEQPVDQGEFLVPASAVTFQDDWHVTGLSGTGSCSVVAERVEVPREHFLSMAALGAGHTPGMATHQQGWNHRAAATPVLIMALAGPALGLARQALADFPGVIGQKSIAYSTLKRSEHLTTHLHLAEAATLVDQASLQLYRSARTIDDHAVAGTNPDLLTRARIRLDCAQAVRNCLAAVELLWRDTGGSGVYRTNPLGQALADLQAMNVHAALALDPAREVYGRVLLGLEPNTPLL
ncbi:MAG: acyl-CoA dehydrogenase family protein [Acidimicrobiales bacterium]